MKIKWEDKEYDFNLNELTVAQAKVIKVHCGLTLVGLEEGILAGDADALRAIYWLMKVQNGEQSNIDTNDFKVMPFLVAFGDAAEDEAGEGNGSENPTEP